MDLLCKSIDWFLYQFLVSSFHTSIQGDAVCILVFLVVNASLLYYLEVMHRGFKSKHSLCGVYPQLHKL